MAQLWAGDAAQPLQDTGPDPALPVHGDGAARAGGRRNGGVWAPLGGGRRAGGASHGGAACALREALMGSLLGSAAARSVPAAWG